MPARKAAGSALASKSLLLLAPGQELVRRSSNSFLTSPVAAGHHATPRNRLTLSRSRPELPGLDPVGCSQSSRLLEAGAPAEPQPAPLPAVGIGAAEPKKLPEPPIPPRPMDPTEPRQQTGSPSDDQEDETFSLVVLSLTEALSLGGLLGNGVMLWLLGSTVYRNPCAIYLLDTACADLIFLGCHMVAIVPDLLLGQSGIPGFVHTSLAALRFFCYLVGLALLAAISLEQCLAALFPARCPCRRPRHLATAVCALSWALCLLLHLLLGGACSQPFGEPGRPLCRAAWLAAAALLAVLSGAVGVSSLLLLLRAERGPPRPAPGAFARLVLLSALLFLFGDLPFGIYWLTRSLRWRAPRRFHALSLLAAGLDRAAKPVVCFCLGSARGLRLREPLRLVLQRALGEDAEPGAGRETPRRGLVEETA